MSQDCKSCATRTARGLEGECPACANERTRSQLRKERTSDPRCNNHTRQDAFSRLFSAKLSCLVDASETYLMALREYLYAWIGEIDAKLTEMHSHHARQQRDVEELGEELGSEEGHIGWLYGGSVACRSCYSSKGALPSGAAPLYKVNVQPYKQHCHTCGKEMVKGRTPAWCELFSKEG